MEALKGELGIKIAPVVLSGKKFIFPDALAELIEFLSPLKDL